MKSVKTILTAVLLLLSAGQALAQNIVPETDSLSVTKRMSDVDSALAGRNLLSVVLTSAPSEGRVTIDQPAALSKGLTKHIENNAATKIRGYRVRIYFDNAQNARKVSQSVADSFSESYPEIAVYRTHESPYFKVTVGDFRSRHDAQLFANSIRAAYPSVFLVRENINFPSF